MWWMLLLSCAKNGETISDESTEPEVVIETAPEPTTTNPFQSHFGRYRVNADWDDGDTFAYVDAITVNG